VDYRTDLIAQVKRDSVERFKDHTVTVQHNEGMYRQWRCQKPGTRNCYFDVTTWPGYLAITGDIGDFVFARCDDMIPWVGGAVRDPGYAAEKCVAGAIYDDRMELVDEWLSEDVGYGNDGIENMPSEKQIALAYLREARTYMESVQQFQCELYNSCLNDGEMPAFQAFRYHFLWCLEALAWWLGKLEE